MVVDFRMTFSHTNQVTADWSERGGYMLARAAALGVGHLQHHSGVGVGHGEQPVSLLAPGDPSRQRADVGVLVLLWWIVNGQLV